MRNSLPQSDLMSVDGADKQAASQCRTCTGCTNKIVHVRYTISMQLFKTREAKDRDAQLNLVNCYTLLYKNRI